MPEAASRQPLPAVLIIHDASGADGRAVPYAEHLLGADIVVLELGTLQTLKRFKDEVNEVPSGQECGMAFQGFQDIKAGDTIECFTLEEVRRTL